MGKYLQISQGKSVWGRETEPRTVLYFSLEDTLGRLQERLYQLVDVRTVASLLGHAQASTTLDIYAHAFNKNKRKAQEKLGKAIGL